MKPGHLHAALAPGRHPVIAVVVVGRHAQVVDGGPVVRRGHLLGEDQGDCLMVLRGYRELANLNILFRRLERAMLEEEE